jgi:hypothetical protein
MGMRLAHSLGAIAAAAAAGCRATRAYRVLVFPTATTYVTAFNKGLPLIKSDAYACPVTKFKPHAARACPSI